MDRSVIQRISSMVTAIALAVAHPTLAQLPRLQRVTEIGCEDCGDARQLASIWDVAVTAGGDVLIVDRDAPNLRMFDQTGRAVWSRGRPGAGPGEYRYAMRAALGDGGSVHVVDMRLRRLTRLAPDGAVLKSLTIPFFPSGVASRARTGELVILTDDFKGNGTVERWAASADTPTRVMSLKTPEPGGGHIFSPSVAVAPNGDVAFMVTGERYEIQRLSASGHALPPITRDVPRPRRTPEEMAASRDRMRITGGAQKASQEKAQPGASRSVLPAPDPLEFRLHASTDGIRYDDTGRLWVKTMRAIGQTTIFDVFSPTGQYVGEVVIPVGVQSYALAGPYLATAGERADGVPVATLWTVK